MIGKFLLYEGIQKLWWRYPSMDQTWSRLIGNKYLEVGLIEQTEGLLY
jgi:hypothetical protein